MNINIEQFQKKGYCVIKNLINEELRDFVTQYALFDEMQQLSTNDAQVPGSHSKYADPAMETMLLHVHKSIEENTGIKLFPTYSYYRVYRNDNHLKSHIDRPSCEISATLCFNHSYDMNDFQWPIFMDGNKVILHPGDAVIYRGCDLNHWREPLVYSEDCWHVQGFFHYVDSEGPYKNFKFDQRESIGEKPKQNFSISDLANSKDLSIGSVKKPYITYTK